MTRGAASIRQSANLRVCSAQPLNLPTRDSKHYPSSGTNQGTIIGPVVLTEVSKEWQATFEQKKEIYGKFRIAVGGKTPGFEGDTKGRRENGDLEMVFYNSMPGKYYSELIHRFFLAYIFDLSPGAGTFGEICIEEGVTYVGIAFTESHAEELNNRFKMASLRLMCDESCSMHYNAKCVMFFGSAV